MRRVGHFGSFSSFPISQFPVYRLPLAVSRFAAPPVPPARGVKLYAPWQRRCLDDDDDVDIDAAVGRLSSSSSSSSSGSSCLAQLSASWRAQLKCLLYPAACCGLTGYNKPRVDELSGLIPAVLKVYSSIFQDLVCYFVHYLIVYTADLFSLLYSSICNDISFAFYYTA